jgi:hypothetical protein
MSVHPPRALIPLLFIACVACDETAMPTRPGSSSVALSIMYRQAIPPPPELRGTGCTHHFATLDLRVDTDWRGSVKLQPAGDRVYTGLLARVPAGEHWITLIDITLCRSEVIPSPDREPFDPYATSTVSINNVALTRVLELSSPTRQALAFTVTSTGAVAP